MPRIRTVKPEYWSDEKLGPLDPVTRLVFLALISMADDAGRVVDNVKQIDAFVFAYSDETAREALGVLAECGRIRRGTSANGMKVIQIVNWHHQKIDKPNFAACLPSIAGDPDDAVSTYRNANRVPTRTKDAVWERDRATCVLCGKGPLRRNKVDRYDSGDDLGEVDHEVERADGGTDEIENLRLTCLPCNRKKAGATRIRRNREASPTRPRGVDDASAPHIGIGSSTTDQLPPTSVAEPARAARATASLRDDEEPEPPPAGLMAMLPAEAMALLAQFYELPAMTRAQRERYRAVSMQLVDALDPKHAGPKIRGGQRVKARSKEHMADVCRAVMRDPPIDRDMAVLFVLKKLLDPAKGPSVTEVVARHQAAERQLEDQYEAEARAAGIAWAKAHPDLYAPILAPIEAKYRGNESSWAAIAKTSELTQLCAAQAGFPRFAEWLERRRPTPTGATA